MESSRETIMERSVFKAAVLDLLADKLECERAEVDFLFGNGAENFNPDTVEIPDVKSSWSDTDLPFA